MVGCTSPPPGCALLPSLGLLGLQARESWLVIRLLPPPPTAISHFFPLISPFEIVKATAEEIIKLFEPRRLLQSSRLFVIYVSPGILCLLKNSNQAMELKPSAHSVASLLLRQFQHQAHGAIMAGAVLTSASPSPAAAFVTLGFLLQPHGWKM